MEIADLQNKLVAVLGYGQEGKAVTKYLLKHGVKPVLFDQRPWEQWNEIEKLDIKKLGLNFIFGSDAFKELAGFDIAFRSPGIKLNTITDYGLRITSQTKWFFDHCPAKIIGVTGTKGKGTTSSLIYEILFAQNLVGDGLDRPLRRHIYLTGNIGKTQPLEILDDLKPNDWVVYELSSFQLQDMEQSPHIGVVLMTTSEHLDYHRNIQEYVEAKSAITKFQGSDNFAVVNSDFENSMKIGKLGHGNKLFFSRFKTVQPGCYAINNQIIAVDNQGEKHDIAIAGQLQLKGAHNLENVCAAVCAAHCAGCSLDVIRDAVHGFKGLEHRLEFVAEKNGVKFYNDSFSTTPETAIAAIRSFDEPLIIILGGSSKNSDFTELGQVIGNAKNIKTLILIGVEGVKIKSSVNIGADKILEGAKNMPEIFQQIKSVASEGDVVLLSPACASFDMFKDYKDRGEQFKKMVKSY